MEEQQKFAIALATIATLAVVAPTIGSIEEFGVLVGDDRDFPRDRSEFRERGGEFRGA